MLDECVFTSVKAIFESLGLKTLDIAGLEMREASDEEVINKAKELAAV